MIGSELLFQYLYKLREVIVWKMNIFDTRIKHDLYD